MPTHFALTELQVGYAGRACGLQLKATPEGLYPLLFHSIERVCATAEALQKKYLALAAGLLFIRLADQLDIAENENIEELYQPCELGFAHTPKSLEQCLSNQLVNTWCTCKRVKSLLAKRRYLGGASSDSYLNHSQTILKHITFEVGGAAFGPPWALRWAVNFRGNSGIALSERANLLAEGG